MNQNGVKLTSDELIRKPKPRSLWSKWGITLFLMALPTIVYIFIFHYMPLEGLTISFKDYNSFQGIWGSPWTSMGGFSHFYEFITAPNFWTLVKNTLVLSVLSIVFNSALPIIYALFLNEVRYKWAKKTIQIIMYAPYFISTVVMVGILFILFRADTGVITKALVAFGFDSSSAMSDPKAFVAIYIVSGLWQGLGWWSIVYMGSLANVDPNLHDAAKIDGAGRFRRIFSVNFPSIVPLAIIMLIMSIGNILNVGFEKVYLMYTPGNSVSSEIISTYVYRISFPDYGLPQFSRATAIGLFNSVINIIILVAANFVSKKVSDNSLW